MKKLKEIALPWRGAVIRGGIRFQYITLKFYPPRIGAADAAPLLLPLKGGAIFLVVLLMAFSSYAQERMACGMRWDKIVQQSNKANQCNEDSDCTYVKMYGCDKGCAILPVYKNLKTHLEIAANNYIASCAGACRPDCGKILEGKCIKRKCSNDIRDWKYLTKQPKG